MLTLSQDATRATRAALVALNAAAHARRMQLRCGLDADEGWHVRSLACRALVRTCQQAAAFPRRRRHGSRAPVAFLGRLVSACVRETEQSVALQVTGVRMRGVRAAMAILQLLGCSASETCPVAVMM